MIVVAGEALVDLLPGPEGSLVPVPGGGPYNAARAIGRLGLDVAWLGGLSIDPFGQMLEAGLAADGVRVDLVQRTNLPTTLALAELDATGSASYRFYTEGTSAPQLVPGVVPAGLPVGTRAVHAGTLGFVLEPMATTLEALVASLPDSLLLLVDPNCRPSITRDPSAYGERVERVLRRADVVKVSTEDLAFLRPGMDTGDAARWVASLGPRAVLVTDGGAAVRVLAAGTAHTVEVPRVDVIDTVGAGDTFGAAALAWLVRRGVVRATLDADAALGAARFAARAAAITCTRAGADPPTVADLGGWPV
ncbi:MAG TPA: carbohydrate kinase [Candidatus Limnocylindrales bacterium]|nr:carbohydrate kinase [Candidatus Limnocylindrales bacterium]